MKITQVFLLVLLVIYSCYSTDNDPFIVITKKSENEILLFVDDQVTKKTYDVTCDQNDSIMKFIEKFLEACGESVNGGSGRHFFFGNTQLNIFKSLPLYNISNKNRITAYPREVINSEILCKMTSFGLPRKFTEEDKYINKRKALWRTFTSKFKSKSKDDEIERLDKIAKELWEAPDLLESQANEPKLITVYVLDKVFNDVFKVECCDVNSVAHLKRKLGGHFGLPPGKLLCRNLYFMGKRLSTSESLKHYSITEGSTIFAHSVLEKPKTIQAFYKSLDPGIKQRLE